MAIADPSPSSPANRPRRAGGDAARALLVLSVVFLPLGLFLPMLETTRFWVLTDQYSLIESIIALFEAGEWGLGALISLFSVALPFAKALALIALHMRDPAPPAGSLARWVEGLGKWSLTDVLVVALLIVVWSGSGVLQTAARPGLWFFAASASCLMLASGLIARDHTSKGEPAAPAPLGLEPLDLEPLEP